MEEILFKMFAARYLYKNNIQWNSIKFMFYKDILPNWVNRAGSIFSFVFELCLMCHLLCLTFAWDS